jgi:hypothetical protein
VTLHEADVAALPLADAAFIARSDAGSRICPGRDVGAGRTTPGGAAGGHVVVWNVDWSTLSWHSPDPVRMGRVLRAWDEHLTHHARHGR